MHAMIFGNILPTELLSKLESIFSNLAAALLTKCTIFYIPVVISDNIFFKSRFHLKKLQPIIQSEVSQKDKDQYSILTHICGI